MCVGHQAHDDGGYACHVLFPPLRRRILGGWVMFRGVMPFMKQGASEEVMPQGVEEFLQYKWAVACESMHNKAALLPAKIAHHEVLFVI